MKFIGINGFIKFLLIAALLIATRQTFGQKTVCLTEQDAQRAIALINANHPAAENKNLRLELLSMKNERQKLDQKIIDNNAKNQQLIATANEMGEKHLLRLCEIVKQNGWLSRESIGADGAEAALLLLKGNRAYKLQQEIFPVVAAAAAKKGLIGNQEVAWMIDSIRTNAGLPQIFGTQTKIKNELFYLEPLQNEAKTDEYRKLYDLPPLADYIKFLQWKYQTVVLKSPPATAQKQNAKQNNPSDNEAVTVNPLVDLGDNEVIKIESNLVSLNVRVSSGDVAAANVPSLQKKDFEIYEDGKKQEIAFFSASDAPFDLILLLDLSGSTADKQDLIRKSTARFIEASRPSDRIAIVTFTDETKVVADLTGNREQLLASIKKIEDRGGSAVWGAIQFAYDKIIDKQSDNRRTAILVMTDGVDSSLIGGSFLPAAYPTFSDVLETVRNGNTTIFPIQLDTTGQADADEKKAYETAGRTLKMFAEESGGQVYYAKKVNDLSGVYEKIIGDLGKVYSLGYEPTSASATGTFHRLTVSLPNHPNLNVRAKQGYYAK